MNSKYIAAIEIGSSRIKGIVAAVGSDSRIKVLAVEETDSGDAVRYGRVQNAREVSKLVNDIVRRLENNPQVSPGRISTVFIADGGRSLLSSPAEVSVRLNAPEELTQQTLERLYKEARFSLGTDRDVLAIAPRRFFVDSAEVKKIVGVFGENVRGEFTIITQAPENRRALDRVIIESHDETVQRDYVTRLLAQTEMALSDSDRQVGCLFIDFGAETTSMAAFRDGSLAFAATLPVGGANITRDLSAALSVTLEKAKNIKHTKGQTVVERNKYEAPDAETREIVNYVSARAGEIIANVNNVLEEAGLKAADFPGGLVITGGGARLKGFPEMVEALTKIKTRRAIVDPAIALGGTGLNLADHFDAVALVKYAAAHSDIDCLSFHEHTAAHVAPDSRQADAPQPAKPESTYIPPAAGYGKRRPVEEDDPGLLKDDPEEVYAETYVDDLPDPDPDPAKTRRTLLDRIKKFKFSELMGSPFEAEQNDMD